MCAACWTLLRMLLLMLLRMLMRMLLRVAWLHAAHVALRAVPPAAQVFRLRLCMRQTGFRRPQFTVCRNRYITTPPSTITIHHSPSSFPPSCPSAPSPSTTHHPAFHYPAHLPLPFPALPYPALRPSLPSYPALPPPSPPGGLGFLRELLIEAKSTEMGGGPT